MDLLNGIVAPLIVAAVIALIRVVAKKIKTRPKNDWLVH